MENPRGKPFRRDEDVYLSPSADGILDVTPVNSLDAESHASSAQSHPSLEEDEDEVSDRLPHVGKNDDAFSSDSDIVDEDDEEDEEDDEEDSEFSSSIPPEYKPSEWDKALLAGRASKGRASDYFVPPNLSLDPSDLMSQTDSSLITKEQSIVGGGTESIDEGSTLSQPMRSTNAGTMVVHSHGSVNIMPSSSPHSNQSYSSQRYNSPVKNKNVWPSSSSDIVRQQSTGGTVSSGQIVRPHPTDDYLSAGVLPDVLMTMRQKIESLTLFDSDMIRLAGDHDDDDDPVLKESRESLKRSSQQSLSPAVLVSLAHKRYERRRLAAMEIEKVVRSLVQQNELERVRAILLLLSDDYVRSTNEDARKGGVVALAASAIGLKKAKDEDPTVQECRDLILASVVHACQDHSQRVRYYATESLFNVVKVIPGLAVQHFFILFEILRSLYADVDADVRSGADLLDKKLKEVIVSAINQGTFTAEACVPVFARFVYMRNKATKRLTLTWLQELNEKLIGAPILEFLHLFLGGIFDMVADPTVAIRQSALAFLQSVLPKLLVVNDETTVDDMVDDGGMKVDFDKILQSLVTTLEHPDPFVRKVAMYWMSRIVKAHMGKESESPTSPSSKTGTSQKLSAAAISVRNSVPHVLPGILLSIGDTYNNVTSTKDSFLPDQATRSLAGQTNACLQDAVRRDGSAYVQHLDGLIVALREELDAPGGVSAKNPPAVERTPYRMDVNEDGTGIETAGWFRASSDVNEHSDDAMIMSRLCALHWVIVLYEHVVPNPLKADYAREFVFPIIHQLADNPPTTIVYKSLEVLAKITVPVSGEDLSRPMSSNSLSGFVTPLWTSATGDDVEEPAQFPMTDASISYALEIVEASRHKLMSRDREVFSALVQLHSCDQQLLADLTGVITYMCKMQPAEFVFVSFSAELDRYIRRRKSPAKSKRRKTALGITKEDIFARDLKFVSSFVQRMLHVLLNADETEPLRNVLKDCVRNKGVSEMDRQKTRMFHILLQSFSHNLAASVALCLWSGAYRTASVFLSRIDPLDINLMFLLEIDRLIEMLERPIFRHLHIRMLERDKDTYAEGSGTMLFQLLKCLLMILPQSTCYQILKDRLTSVSRFRQSTSSALLKRRNRRLASETEVYVSRVEQVRVHHCAAIWRNVRSESLEMPIREAKHIHDEGADRREWLGYSSREDHLEAQRKFREAKSRKRNGPTVEERPTEYQDLSTVTLSSTSGQAPTTVEDTPFAVSSDQLPNGDDRWKSYWAISDQ